MSVVSDFLEGARAVGELLESDRLEMRWHEESGLEGFRISGLAGHLVRAVTVTAEVLQRPVPDGEPMPLVPFFVWATSGWDAQRDAIRDRGEEAAKAGLADLQERYREGLRQLETELEGCVDRRVLRNDRVLGLEDFLVVRAVELLVHLDDLAVSLDAPRPAVPEALVDRVVDLLVATAAARHGSFALLVAMTRRERDHVEALRVV